MAIKILLAVLLFVLLIKTNGYLDKTHANSNFIYNPNINESAQRNTTLQPKLICFYVFTNAFKAYIMDGLCTHIIVGFLRINKNNYSVTVSNENLEYLSQVVSLKKRNKDLKIIISVGGSGLSSFSPMISTHKRRKMFIRSAFELIKKYKLDGIDLDWEWPAINGNSKEKIKFVQLLHEIRTEFNRHRKKYILCADVGALQTIIEISYYVKYIADYVDFVNIMCYDYHYYKHLFPFTGYNAPLFSPESKFSTLNTNYSVHFWIWNLMPREKIMLGMPTYGHSYQLSVSNKVDLYAPASGPGTIGTDGFVDYQQICNFTKQLNTTVVFDNHCKVPYTYNFPEWISFDNEDSLAAKASYVLEEGLGGAMIFSVNADDYAGTCSKNGIMLPLIRTVRSILFNEV